MPASAKTTASTADYLGILSAFICLLHCLAGPLLLGAAMHLHDHSSFVLWQEWNYLFLVFGFGAVWWSSKHTHSRILRIGLWVTFGLLALAVGLENYAEKLHYLVYFSSVGLIIAHIFNLRAKLSGKAH